MLRASLCSLAVLVILTGGLFAADEKNKDNKDATKAAIVKVDAKDHSIVLKMKDKDGKEVERTFKLTEDIRLLDDKGEVVAIDVFKSGNEVLVVEREGKLRELRQHRRDKDK